ncbi:hypothetical protein Lazarus_046 [Acinetobacter phage vB_AbaM_Lazarus]|uniref:Uncharacterized protein n=1 Tax=Acinetobacter phage vB_AbaM_Lazarus TaxID=2686289 RepID=A0A6B9SXZ9_9CAUD|nr:hypothetical protein HYQ23_gp046 [Acinetobacter phage vB_AbaM_Lazarus]QHJ73982.1 hypothetical protein Lazarus_046 [Acinetobacter phage vB_AbaM_Lazarus]
MVTNQIAQDENPEQHHLGISIQRLSDLIGQEGHKMPSGMSRTKRRNWAKNRVRDMYINREIDKIAGDVCSVQPMSPNLFDDLEEARKSFIDFDHVTDLLPKFWEPKHEYVEIFKGTDDSYTEMIVLKSDVKDYIHQGWRISRLSKISRALVYKKWVHAIIAIEQKLDNEEKQFTLNKVCDIIALSNKSI